MEKMDDRDVEAVKKLKEFNENNRFRDAGVLNNAIDRVLRLVKELAESNQELDKECSRLERKELEMERYFKIATAIIGKDIEVAKEESEKKYLERETIEKKRDTLRRRRVYRGSALYCAGALLMLNEILGEKEDGEDEY